MRVEKNIQVFALMVRPKFFLFSFFFRIVAVISFPLIKSFTAGEHSGSAELVLM